mgnify:CR=1 FL=1
MSPIFCRLHNDGLILSVRVIPKSSRSQIVGVVGEELKISLHAPPTEGQANKELIHLLSKTFSLSKSQIELLSGETSRSKRVLLRGISLEQFLERNPVK